MTKQEYACIGAAIFGLMFAYGLVLVFSKNPQYWSHRTTGSLRVEASRLSRLFVTLSFAAGALGNLAYAMQREDISMKCGLAVGGFLMLGGLSFLRDYRRADRRTLKQ